MKRVAVIGAGAWGTAIAMATDRAGSDVLLWAREPEVIEAINTQHENTIFLKGISLSESVKASNNLEDVLDREALFMVVPAQFTRAMCQQLVDIGLDGSIPLVLCSKGVTQQGLKFMNEVVEETMPNPVVVLSGPTFASEVARGLPASVILACKDKALNKQIASTIESPNFKVFFSHDIIGAEIGGAIKNVIAVACGIAEGAGIYVEWGI